MTQIIFAVQSTRARAGLLFQVILHNIWIFCYKHTLFLFFPKRTSPHVSLACGSPDRWLNIFLSSSPCHFHGNSAEFTAVALIFRRLQGLAQFQPFTFIMRNLSQRKSDGADQTFYLPWWSRTEKDIKPVLLSVLTVSLPPKCVP